MNIEDIRNIETKIIGKVIEYYEEIDSTHDYAKNNIDKLKSGTVILAEKQTAGKGTKGRKWYTGANKNIALTIALKPECNIGNISTLTVDIAVIVQKTIKELYGYELKIKDPNDLIINDRKVAGILTESSTIGDKLKYIVLSLGFNVNEDIFDKDTEKIATSLRKEYKKIFSREEIIKCLLKNIDEYYVSKV